LLVNAIPVSVAMEKILFQQANLHRRPDCPKSHHVNAANLSEPPKRTELLIIN
jgi:hypothetical protein